MAGSWNTIIEAANERPSTAAVHRPNNHCAAGSRQRRNANEFPCPSTHNSPLLPQVQPDETGPVLGHELGALLVDLNVLLRRLAERLVVFKPGILTALRFSGLVGLPH